MATDVLRPQDLFADRRFRPRPGPFHRRRNLTVTVNRKAAEINNTNSDRKVSPRSDRSDNNNGNNDRRVSPRSDRRRSPVAKKTKSNNNKDDVSSVGLVNGRVTLLKRGEPLDLVAMKVKGGGDRDRNPNSISNLNSNKAQANGDDVEVCGSKRIGPESPSLMVPKQLRLRMSAPPPTMFAGSVITTSPSPRALPLPSFFNMKQQQDSDSDPDVDDFATRDLRRMLRLE